MTETNREAMDRLRAEREARFQRMIWAMIGLLAVAALIATVVALNRAPPEQLVCHRWDYSEAVLATRQDGEISFTDHNGVARKIEGPDAADWDCSK